MEFTTLEHIPIFLTRNISKAKRKAVGVIT